METFVNKLAESKFMKTLEKISDKLSASPAFSSLSLGMGGTMGLIMIGAVVQIVLAIGTTFFGLDSSGEFYTRFYAIYQMTMGCMGLFMAFNLAYTYAKKMKMNGVQAGFTSMICFFLVCSPIQSATADGGATFFNAISIDALGTGGLFVALIIGLVSVRISKFAVDHHLVIRMPDVVPEGILASFNSIIPSAINIALWYGIATAISIFTQGATTLPNLITYVLSIPLSYLFSPIGMILIICIAQLFWFFGIHGSGVIFSVIMVPYMAAYMTNAELAAQGLPLVFNAVFIMSGQAALGGAGNTLPLILMGLRSKSETIKTVSKAALPAGLFNINEPVIFGFPIMYNPIMLIPFVLCPVVCCLLFWAAYATGLIALPQVLILTTLPVLMHQFMSALDWKNVVFEAVLFPVCWIIYYPFFKVYERQMIAQEAEAANENHAE